MDFNVLLGIFGGLGIGTLVNSAYTLHRGRQSQMQDRLYSEKREAYLGLLQSLHDAAISPSDANSKNFALWQTRCSLFGSQEVSTYIQAIIDTNDGPREDREHAFQKLLDEMKKESQ